MTAIVLAAGHSARMRSTRPKPLHPLCGKPMLVYVLEALAGAGPDRQLVVVGSAAEQVSKKLVEAAPDISVELVPGSVIGGTGEAVAAALAALDDLDPAVGFDDGDDVIVVPADVPLVTSATITRLIEAHRRTGAAATVSTSAADGTDGDGDGVIIDGRADEVGSVSRHDDAPRAGAQVASGLYCFRHSLLAPALRRVAPSARHGDVAVGDAVAVLHDAGHRTLAVLCGDDGDLDRVDDRVDLAQVEAQLRARTNRRWLQAGVTMVDPARTVVDTTVELATDVTLFPGTLLQGATVVGEGAEIGPDTHLVDCAVGQGAQVRQTVGRDAEIGSYADVGPFAVLEPGASIPPATTTGPHHVARAGPDVS